MNTQQRIRDLLSEARRAQEVVSAVDLDGVAAHDPEAVAGLDAAIDALVRIEAGEAPATPAPAAPPKVDPEVQRQRQLIERLNAVGLEERIGCAYFSGTEFPIKPFRYAQHQHGLPAFDVCIAPDYAPLDGIHGVFVSARGVFAAVVANPVADNEWKIARSVPWESPEQLVETVKRFVAHP